MSSWADLIGHPHHLVARWWWTMRATAPTAADDEWARSFLTGGECDLWSQMSPIDQAHSIQVARCVIEHSRELERAVIAGALLHDVGKIVSQLSTWERVVATLIGSRTERFRQYHDHEAIGAELAAQAGSDPVTVALIAGTDDGGEAAELLSRCDR
ncbi:MAG: hypothetical protein CSA55_03330 [Ilumatobacter coccineus]|uniref:HD domain-containing protein n=1 Tax=Ilumatobacter coccineus TaxID=467094 RepID=A0A2G6K9X9_9ACTN|nr:MAG: hypothetical protein CSA55_03330 [Ilumatobacter coccineus]